MEKNTYSVENGRIVIHVKVPLLSVKPAQKPQYSLILKTPADCESTPESVKFASFLKSLSKVYDAKVAQAVIDWTNE